MPANPDITVEARFYVSGLQRFAYDPSQTEVTLQVVCRGKHNQSWAAATPTGKITMVIKNEAAGAWFSDNLGKELSVVFTPAPADG